MTNKASNTVCMLYTRENKKNGLGYEIRKSES